MSFTLCSSGAIVNKAGANVNSSAAASGALLSQFCDFAEAYVCGALRIDAVSQYSSLTNATTKLLLGDATSSIAANELVKYDMSGYSRMNEAQTILDVNDNRANVILTLLKDKDVSKFIGLK